MAMKMLDSQKRRAMNRQDDVLDEIADIPAEVIEAAHRQENAGGDAQLLAEFVLELGVRT
jgi:hypothetical protein